MAIKKIQEGLLVDGPIWGKHIVGNPTAGTWTGGLITINSTDNIADILDTLNTAVKNAGTTQYRLVVAPGQTMTFPIADMIDTNSTSLDFVVDRGMETRVGSSQLIYRETVYSNIDFIESNDGLIDTGDAFGAVGCSFTYDYNIDNINQVDISITTDSRDTNDTIVLLTAKHFSRTDINNPAVPLVVTTDQGTLITVGTHFRLVL